MTLDAANWAGWPPVAFSHSIVPDERVPIAAAKCAHPMHPPPVHLGHMAVGVEYVDALSALALDAERASRELAKRERELFSLVVGVDMRRASEVFGHRDRRMCKGWVFARLAIPVH